MYSESRMTRSRARVAVENGQTPCLVALPTDGPATTRTGRKTSSRRTVEDCAPAVLFDITNSDSAEVVEAQTPANRKKTVQVVGPTPTGLGLSTLPPVTPGQLVGSSDQAGHTPMPTPAHGQIGAGVEVDRALKAAAKALLREDPVSPMQTPHYEPSPAATLAPFTSAYFSPAATLSPAEFSTPPESPCMSVSVGDAIAAAAVSPGVESSWPGQVPAASPAPSPAALAAPGVTLHASPAPLESASPPFPTPKDSRSALAPVASPTATTPGLSPAILFIAEGGQTDAATAEEEPANDAPVVPVPAGTRVASKVTVPDSGFDPRSLRQLKKEIAERMAVRSSRQDAEEEGHEEEEHADCDEEEGAWDGEEAGAAAGELTSALAGLDLGPVAKLQGLPTPAGTHIRFEDDDEGNLKPEVEVLRGVAPPAGRHIRFED